MATKRPSIKICILNFILTSLLTSISVIVLLSFVGGAVFVEENMQITTGFNQNMPAWSPDGATVAYISKLSGNYDVWTMAADGSNNVRLTDSPVDD